MRTNVIGIVLFEGFETLDVFGPIQMWGRLPDHEVVLISADGHPARSCQNVSVNVDFSFGDAPLLEILVVPGGMGTRKIIGDDRTLDFIRSQDRSTRLTLSICTGAALLAKAGLLSRRRATTNKVAFDWVSTQDETVEWQRSARWVVDGKYLTSSGVSAGTDLALALVESLYDRDLAEKVARDAEYVWNDDPSNDPFALPAT